MDKQGDQLLKSNWPHPCTPYCPLHVIQQDGLSIRFFIFQERIIVIISFQQRKMGR